MGPWLDHTSLDARAREWHHQWKGVLWLPILKEEGRRVPWSAMVQVLYSQFACGKIIMSWAKEEGRAPWSGTVHSRFTCDKIIMSWLCLGGPIWYDDVHKTPNFTHLHSSSIYQMLFVLKHPSVVPHALCASKCPTHNVFHSATEYPQYYDPLYFPKCHVSLFESEVAICVWLLNNLQIYSIVCSSCPPLCPLCENFEDSVGLFRIFFLLSMLPVLIFKSLRLLLSPFCFTFVTYIIVLWY